MYWLYEGADRMSVTFVIYQRQKVSQGDDVPNASKNPEWALKVVRNNHLSCLNKAVALATRGELNGVVSA